MTTEKLPAHMDYEQIVSDFYAEITTTIACHLDAGRDVAVIAEGDPFFYGSFMYIHDRLAEKYETEVVPAFVLFWALLPCLAHPWSTATRPCRSFRAS